MITPSNAFLQPCSGPPAPDVRASIDSQDIRHSDASSFNAALDQARAVRAPAHAPPQSRSERISPPKRPADTHEAPESDSTASSSEERVPAKEGRVEQQNAAAATTAQSSDSATQAKPRKKKAVSAQETAGLLAAAALTGPSPPALDGGTPVAATGKSDIGGAVQTPGAALQNGGAVTLQTPAGAATSPGDPTAAASLVPVPTTFPSNSSVAPMDSQSGVTAGSGVGNASVQTTAPDGSTTSPVPSANPAPLNNLPPAPASSVISLPAAPPALVSAVTQAAADKTASLQAGGAAANSAHIPAEVVPSGLKEAKTAPELPAGRSGVKKLDGIDRLLVVKDPPPARSAQDTAVAIQNSAPDANAVQTRLATSALAPATGPGNLSFSVRAQSAGIKATGVSNPAGGPVDTAGPGSPILSPSAAPVIGNGLLPQDQDTVGAGGTAVNAAVKESAILASKIKDSVSPTPSLSETAPLFAGPGRSIAGDASGGSSFGSPQHAPSERQTRQTQADAVGGLSGAANASGAALLRDAETQAAGAQPAAPTPSTDHPHVAEQIAKHLESVQFTDGRSEMTLRLAPDHLGSLHLTISTGDHGVTARIVVETSQAQQAVEGSKDQLRQALESHGMHLSSLDVSLSQNGTGSGAQTFAQQQQQAKEFADRAAHRALGRSEAAVPELITAPAVHSGLSSHSASRLDYRA